MLDSGELVQAIFELIEAQAGVPGSVFRRARVTHPVEEHEGGFVWRAYVVIGPQDGSQHTIAVTPGLPMHARGGSEGWQK